VSHRALHLIFRQVGEASKGLEVGLMALSGVMMGSATFGIYAVVEGVKALIAHFERQRQIALEAAKATVQFWTDALRGNADARKAAGDYATALQKIITNVDTLKQKESEEEAVLKRLIAARLAILAAMEKADLAGAKGDKAEEARINARYGRAKSVIELENEQDEINLKKQHLAEQIEDNEKKEQAMAAAEDAKEAGFPGRTEAGSAEERLPKLTEELAKLQAARMKPEELAALREEVSRRAGEAGFNVTTSGPQESAAGYARRKLSGAENAEQAYSAAQQDYEQSQADIESFKTGTAALAKAVVDATEGFKKAVEAGRTTNAQIATAEAVHEISLGAAKRVGGIQAGAIIQAGGGRDTPLNRSIVSDIYAMEGAAGGRPMDKNQTAMVNHLVAGLQAQGNSHAAILKLLLEMKDLHVDAEKKFTDISAALRKVHGAAPRTF
jgi:hypothetical protein